MLRNQRSCAVLSDGTAKCWGNNDHGELGDGTTTWRPTPDLVQGLSNAVPRNRRHPVAHQSKTRERARRGALARPRYARGARIVLNRRVSNPAVTKAHRKQFQRPRLQLPCKLPDCCQSTGCSRLSVRRSCEWPQFRSWKSWRSHLRWVCPRLPPILL